MQRRHKQGGPANGMDGHVVGSGGAGPMGRCVHAHVRKLARRCRAARAHAARHVRIGTSLERLHGLDILDWGCGSRAAAHDQPPRAPRAVGACVSVTRGRWGWLGLGGAKIGKRTDCCCEDGEGCRRGTVGQQVVGHAPTTPQHGHHPTSTRPPPCCTTAAHTRFHCTRAGLL